MRTSSGETNLPRHCPHSVTLALIVVLPFFAAEAPAQIQHHMIWGTVYNVFHEEYPTDQEFFQQVDKDIAAIRDANLDQIMIFPMSQWDPGKQELRWTRTDYLIRKIEEADLHFVPILLKEEQCSYYFPPWKFKDIDGLWDAYNLNNGEKNNRDNVDFADPRVYPLLESYIKAVATRYGKSPALSFYNLWNEPHYHATSDRTVEAFRKWLREKYGTIERLNTVWGDAYHAWDEVSPFLTDNWHSSMPQIDWALFRNELDGSLLGRLRSTLRMYDTVHPVNANPVGTPWADFSKFGWYATDNWVFTEFNDINGVSYYPDGWERTHNLLPCPAWLQNLALNTIRCASGAKNYILTEMYTFAQNGFALNGYLDKKAMNALVWTAFSNDCKGIIFWKWEPFRRGRQSLGRGLTTLEGELAPRGEAVKEIGRVLKEHGDILFQARLDTPRVAILMDMVGLLKTLEQTVEPLTTNFMYESNAGLFKALYEENIPVDLVRTDRGVTLDQLERYRILFLPFQVVVRRGVAEMLKEYVRRGGRLVADARSATIDEFDVAYRRSPGAGLDEVFGARRKDWDGKNGFFPVRMNSLSDTSTYVVEGRFFRDDLVPTEDVEVSGRFVDDGAPAVIIHPYGEGRAILSAIPLGGSCYGNRDTLACRAIVDLVHDAGVWPEATFEIQGQGGLDLKVHSARDTKVVYLLNHDSFDKSGTITLRTGKAVPVKIVDILSNASLLFAHDRGTTTFHVDVPADGVLVLEVREKP